MLLDRSDERAALDRVVGTASNGLSGSLVLHGEVGMGKTALLDYAGEVAPMQVIRIAGIEAEQDFSFAALHRLLQPSLDRIDRLPGPQRDGLSSAFGLASRSPADPFLIGLATLTLLADAAAERGLLCIVDDSQWIDLESLQAMTFAARRLQADGIALLFGLRTTAEISLDFAGLPALEISGLPKAAAHELLSTVVEGPLDSRVAQNIVEQTSGCPLALMELSHDLSAAQWEGADRVEEPLPISRRLEAHFHRQVEALPRGVQMFLLAGAAETSGDVLLVRKAAFAVGCDRDSEAIAVQAHLLTATEPVIEFRHPLIRSAVYTGATPADRRQVHRALADSIDRAADPDRWAQHLAAIATGYDDQLATHLEAGATRARDRGGFAAEASLLTQAARYTEQPEERSRRLLEASAATFNAGASTRARALLREARADLTNPYLQAQAQQLDGRLRVFMIQPGRAPASLLSAAQQFLPLDAQRHRESLLEAIEAFLNAQHFTVDTDRESLARAALVARGSDSARSLADLLLDGSALLLAERYVDAVEDLRKAAGLLRDGPVSLEESIRWAAFGMVIANELWEDRTYIAWIENVEAVARKLGALVALQWCLVGLAVHQVRIGNFSGADAYYVESLEMTAATGGIASLAVDLYEPFNSELLAWRGDEAGTRSAVRKLVDIGESAGMAVAQFQGYHALAILELGLGKYSEALRAAEYCCDRIGLGWRGRAWPIVIEAGVRSGNPSAAARAMAELELHAAASGTPWALGLLARSRALMAEATEAENFFEESIVQLSETLVATDLAWSRLVYGQWLRRQSRRVDARTQLRAAYEAFSSMGAELFAERARTELLATGERTRRRSIESTNTLTSQELKIARLASQGATNPEIAAQMFVSTSTVDYHLRKIYRKLDISSRRQLERALPS